jgi:hypothetical protein
MHWNKLFVLGILSAACGSSTPTNFAGTYTITIVDGANACQFPNWNPGDASTNITAQITQDASLAQIMFPPNTLVGAYMLVVLGTDSFSGQVTGNEFKASYLGSKPITQGSCTYNVKVDLDVTLDTNDLVSGTLTYTPLTNGDASCGALNACSNVQTVNGARTAK